MCSDTVWVIGLDKEHIGLTCKLLLLPSSYQWLLFQENGLCALPFKLPMFLNQLLFVDRLKPLLLSYLLAFIGLFEKILEVSVSFYLKIKQICFMFGFFFKIFIVILI